MYILTNLVHSEQFEEKKPIYSLYFRTDSGTFYVEFVFNMEFSFDVLKILLLNATQKTTKNKALETVHFAIAYCLN